MCWEGEILPGSGKEEDKDFVIFAKEKSEEGKRPPSYSSFLEKRAKAANTTLSRKKEGLCFPEKYPFFSHSPPFSLHKGAISIRFSHPWLRMKEKNNEGRGNFVGSGEGGVLVPKGLGKTGGLLA